MFGLLNQFQGGPQQQQGMGGGAMSPQLLMQLAQSMGGGMGGGMGGLPVSSPTPGGVPPAKPLTPGMGAAPAAAGPVPTGGGNPLDMMGMMAGGLGAGMGGGMGGGGGSTTTMGGGGGGGGGGNRNWLGAVTDPARAVTNRIAPGLHPLGAQGGGDRHPLLRFLGGF